MFESRARAKGKAGRESREEQRNSRKSRMSKAASKSKKLNEKDAAAKADALAEAAMNKFM